MAAKKDLTLPTNPIDILALIATDEYAGQGGTYYIVDGHRVPAAEYLTLNEQKEASDGEQTQPT